MTPRNGAASRLSLSDLERIIRGRQRELSKLQKRRAKVQRFFSSSAFNYVLFGGRWFLPGHDSSDAYLNDILINVEIRVPSSAHTRHPMAAESDFAAFGHPEIRRYRANASQDSPSANGTS
jgi:hypothetical protein